MRKDLKSVSGVYAFETESDKVNIGSSVNLASRAMHHIRNTNISSNAYLQNTIA